MGQEAHKPKNASYWLLTLPSPYIPLLGRGTGRQKTAGWGMEAGITQNRPKMRNAGPVMQEYYNAIKN